MPDVDVPAMASYKMFVSWRDIVVVVDIVNPLTDDTDDVIDVNSTTLFGDILHGTMSCHMHCRLHTKISREVVWKVLRGMLLTRETW